MGMRRLVISALPSGLWRLISSGMKSDGSLLRVGRETTDTPTLMAVPFALKGFEEPAGLLRTDEIAFRPEVILPLVQLA